MKRIQKYTETKIGLCGIITAQKITPYLLSCAMSSVFSDTQSERRTRNDQSKGSVFHKFRSDARTEKIP